MPTEPSLALTDCHLHIFEDERRWPFSPERSYTPESAPFERYHQLASEAGISRHVLVQPSVYGSDNRLHLERSRSLGDKGRAVVVLDRLPSDTELEEMHASGARGVRFNLLFSGGSDPELLFALEDRIRESNWHIQLLIDIRESIELVDRLSSLQVPLVFDHLGHFQSEAGVNEPAFQKLLSLLQDEKGWVKLSGFYRAGSGRFPYEEKRPLVEALLKTNSDRIVWGSDWPHPAVDAEVPTISELKRLTEKWLSNDMELIRKVFQDNPAALYDF